MDRVAIICHSHHKKSKAFEYIINALVRYYKVDRYWDHEWEGGDVFSISDINNIDYKLIIFIQRFPKFTILDQLRCKNIVWIPMYDSEYKLKKKKYLSLIAQGVKVISFSKYLYENMKSMGHDIEYVQLFPKERNVLNGNNYRGSKYPAIFYWPRVKDISWQVVKKLLGSKFKGEVVIHNAPDPNYTFELPSERDIKKYNIKIIDGWLPFEEGLEIRSKSDIFIAPRLYEGIGLTFLEAMASGVAVVSPNYSTMNEYIEGNYNGYLYDINNVTSLDFSELEDVKKRAYESIKNGHKEWKEIGLSTVFNVCEREYKRNVNIFYQLYCKIYIHLARFKESFLRY